MSSTALWSIRTGTRLTCWPSSSSSYLLSTVSWWLSHHVYIQSPGPAKEPYGMWVTWRHRWAVALTRVSITGIPPCFLILDTSLNIKTVISKVSISFLISRLKIWKSRFQSRYKDYNFKSLDFSLNIKTQLPNILIPVSISRIKFKKSKRIV